MTPSRRAGVLVPLFSLSSTRGWGIGEIGDIADTARWLESAGQRLLQFWRDRAASAPTSPDLRRYLDEQAEYVDALIRGQRDAP